MRHLFVTQDYAPDLGGMARRHVELCRRFAPDEVIVSTVASPGAAAFDRHESYAIHREPFPFDRANRFVNQIRWARSLSRECARGIDIVHCANIRPSGYAVLMARWRRRVPYVVYVYGGDLLREREKTRNPAKRLVARRLFGEASGVVAISDWSANLARDLMASIGVDAPPPVGAIELGTDPRQFHPSRDQGRLRGRYSLGDAPLILTAARLVPHKGQDVGVRALARLSGDFPRLRYLLIGDGPDAPRLAALARELDVADRVLFAGAVSDDELAEAYATATVYLGASRVDRGINAEGFGISFVEAGASGVPSVAGDSGGVRSAVRDGETGFVVPPEDVEAVTEALRALLSDDARRRAMGAAARRAVEQHYNWDRVARETLAFARRVTVGAA